MGGIFEKTELMIIIKYMAPHPDVYFPLAISFK